MAEGLIYEESEETKAETVTRQLNAYIAAFNDLKFMLNQSNKENSYDDEWIRNAYIVLFGPNTCNEPSYADFQLRREIRDMFSAYVNIHNANLEAEKMTSTSSIIISDDIAQERELKQMMIENELRKNKLDLIKCFSHIWYITDAIFNVNGYTVDEASTDAKFERILDENNPDLAFNLLIDHISKLIEHITKYKDESEDNESKEDNND